MKVINRYVLREHLGPLVFSMSALTSLLLLNYIAKKLPELVGKGLPAGVIVEFVVLSLPFTIAMTLPMAVLVATLHAFSRLAADSEITAFKASGLALPRLMMPVVIGGMLLSAVMVWFNDQVMPAANYELSTLMNDIARKKPTFALHPRSINEVSPGRLFLSAGRIDAGSSAMRDVTIYDFSDNQRRRTIRADSGRIMLSPDGRDLLLTLSHGYMTEVNRTEMDRMQRVFYETNFVRVKNVGNDLERNTTGGEKSDRERTVCELQAQLRRAIRQRDSLYIAIRKLDSAAVKSLGKFTPATGSGTLYCRFVNLLRTAEAHAATLPPVTMHAGAQGGAQGGARGATPVGTPATVPIQALAANADLAVATQHAADSITKSGALLAKPAPQSDLAPPTPVLLEGMKLQFAGAEGVINGNLVEIEKKFAIATACMIFALLGAPIAFRFPRGGVGLTIGVSLGVFGIYYIGLIVGEELARRGYLPAFVAMWATNAMLLVAGVVLTARLGTEGTTHRGSEISDRFARFMERVRRRSQPPATT